MEILYLKNQLKSWLVMVVVFGGLNGCSEPEAIRNVAVTWISAGVEMVRIPVGEFMMGSSDDKVRNPDEAPVHKVIFKKAFWMGKYEVTQKLWKSVMGSNPSEFRGKNLPVDSVSWDDIQLFLTKLNQQTKMSFRLPSEAEWEYAARAGTSGRFSFAAPISTKLANYDGTLDKPAGEYRERTMPVDSFKPNPWGLYQVHGNVVEWVQDCRHDSYKHAPTDGSPWLSENCKKRILKGGSWDFTARESRSAHRFWLSPDSGYNITGFRLVLN